MIGFKPSDVALGVPPLVGTMGRSENEVAAAIVVRCLALTGDTWRAQIDIRTAAGAAREAVENLAPAERVTALALAQELERAALAEERDSLRARLADLEAAMGKQKRTRAPRQPASGSIAVSDLRTLALDALDQPRTVDEVAQAVHVTRGQATEALADLVTDGRARKVRAGRGWRFERTPAVDTTPIIVDVGAAVMAMKAGGS